MRDISCRRRPSQSAVAYLCGPLKPLQDSDAAATACEGRDRATRQVHKASLVPSIFNQTSSLSLPIIISFHLHLFLYFAPLSSLFPLSRCWKGVDAQSRGRRAADREVSPPKIFRPSAGCERGDGAILGSVRHPSFHYVSVVTEPENFPHCCTRRLYTTHSLLYYVWSERVRVSKCLRVLEGACFTGTMGKQSSGPGEGRIWTLHLTTRFSLPLAGELLFSIPHLGKGFL